MAFYAENDSPKIAIIDLETGKEIVRFNSLCVEVRQPVRGIGNKTIAHDYLTLCDGTQKPEIKANASMPWYFGEKYWKETKKKKA